MPGASGIRLRLATPLSSGEKLVNLLAQILWYLDSHHYLLGERSNNKLPQIFDNYNKPEF